MTEQQAIEALVEFLRARLDEDGQTAHAASDGPWMPWRAGRVSGLGHLEHAVMRPGQKAGSRAPIATASWVDAEHIARHNPARTLREVEAAKRLISASAVDCPQGCQAAHTFSGSCALRWMGPAWEADGERWAHDENDTRVPAPPVVPVYVLRQLAAVYADHPDYREEWRP